jgi:ribonuclease HI
MNDEQIIQGKALVAFTDGGCEPNPGHGGAAYILRDANGAQISARGYYLGDHSTNNISKLAAVIRAAEGAQALGATSLEIFADSKLTVMVFSGKWRAKLPHLQALRDQALAVLNRIPQWTIQWVPREMNQAADTVAGNAVRSRRDVDYSAREILDPVPTYAERVRGAVKDYMHAARTPRRQRRFQKV